MSNLNIFKVGVGPSSSHTLGPLLMGNRFCALIQDKISDIAHLKVILYGSLSLTGKGHLTDKAIVWGLSNLTAKHLNADIQNKVNEQWLKHRTLHLAGIKHIRFTEEDVVFTQEFLPLHANALHIVAFDKNRHIIAEKTYYSIGGGFVKDEEEMRTQDTDNAGGQPLALLLNNAQDALDAAQANHYSLATLSLNYEKQFHSEQYIRDYCMEIWEVMQEVYESGIRSEEIVLPGSLRLKRRAKSLAAKLQTTQDPLGLLDFISLYALSIAEENASGNRVVTAPTNGACAVVPAVMLYLKKHTPHFTDEKAVSFLLSAMLIGSFYKKNASISGAEAGCQAEIGSASSMAAGAMADSLGASIQTAFIAAEIAMEHHLGLTCDPAGGLVQVPCIERNAFGAIKAISAVKMAMARDTQPLVSLDEIIQTMYETGKDMSSKYKETSIGGLALTLDKKIC